MASSAYRGFYFMNSQIENPLLTLNGSYARAWDYLLRNMKSGNQIVIIQTVVAKELDVTPQFMSKVLRKLLTKGLIVKNGKSQHNIIYMINPNYAWNGKADAKDAGTLKFSKLIQEQ